MLTLESHYLSFCVCLSTMSDAYLTSFPRQSLLWNGPRIGSFSQCFFFLCRVQIQPHMHSPMPWWCNIHQVIFEGLSFRCYELISRFWKLFMEFKFLRPDAISFVNIGHLLQTWSPPRRSFANINVDATIGPN